MDLVEAVTATCAVTGTEFTDFSLSLIVTELRQYPPAAVEEALARCRRECRRITLADILDRMPGQHPKPEEAWAIVARGLGNEWVSIVWTDEMREAFAVANALSGDSVAARMAFKESYADLVSRARAQRRAPVWSVSLGYDQHGRELAVTEALEKNRISQAQAAKLLPPSEPVLPEVLALVQQVTK